MKFLIMKKFKILKILSTITILTLIGNLKVFVAKNDTKNSVSLLEKKLKFQKDLLKKESLTLKEIERNISFNQDYYFKIMVF